MRRVPARQDALQGARPGGGRAPDPRLRHNSWHADMIGPRPEHAGQSGFTAMPDEILPLDERRVLARGRHGGQGVKGVVDAKFVHIWTLTNDRVSKYEQLADTRRFCDAVGK
jgi:hypothetical protein